MKDKNKFVWFVLRLGLVLLISLTAVAVWSTNAAKGVAAPDAATMLYMPVTLSQNDGSLDTPIFGVQMYFDTSNESVYYPYLTGSQASWLRVAIPWGAVEAVNTTPDNFNWSVTDPLLSAARNDHGNIKIIASIVASPAWAASSPEGVINSGNLNDFASFMGALVERYDGDGYNDAPGSPVVNHWEMYNEPDAGPLADPERWGYYGSQYAQMLAIANAAIKGANPAAQVVFGGIAYDWFEDQNGPFVRHFLDDVLAAGGGKYFDIMNFHSYPAFNYNWTDYGPGLKEKAAVIRDKLQSYGLNKPIIVTEAGWHSNNPANFPSSEEIQARYVVELFTQSFAADLPVMIWWMLYDPGGPYWNNGLVSDGSPPQVKSSYLAYQNIVAELQHAHFTRALSDAETGSEKMEAYAFRDDTLKRITYVAWLNPVDTNDTLILRLPAATATIRSIFGSAYVLNDADDGDTDGHISLPVGGQPVYVEVPQ